MMRKEYNKFLVKSITKNKFVDLTFCVMAICYMQSIFKQ